jgi:plastocyanin
MRILSVLIAGALGAADILHVPVAANPPGAGGLRGRVEIRRALAPIERRPGVTDLGSAGARDLPDRRRAVVYLETAPGRAFEDREPDRARMDQRNETFIPTVLAITSGTVVDFPNNDRTYHNVFSLSKPKRFDLGRYAQGRSKSVRFDRPGIVRVFCDIHSHMSAFILVFSHRYFATTDNEGRYRINNIPSGTYSVVAWHDGADRETRTVTIPDGGSVELDFVVQ